MSQSISWNVFSQDDKWLKYKMKQPKKEWICNHWHSRLTGGTKLVTISNVDDAVWSVDDDTGARVVEVVEVNSFLYFPSHLGGRIVKDHTWVTQKRTREHLSSRVPAADKHQSAKKHFSERVTEGHSCVHKSVIDGHLWTRMWYGFPKGTIHKFWSSSLWNVNATDAIDGETNMIYYKLPGTRRIHMFDGG